MTGTIANKFHSATGCNLTCGQVKQLIAGGPLQLIPTTDLSNAYLTKHLFSVRMNRMVKKSDKAELDRRIHAVVKLLSSAKTSSYVCRYARDE